MKKKFVAVTLLISMLCQTTVLADNVFVAPKGSINITLNGKPTTATKPFAIVNDSVYVSLRDMCEILGVNVTWDGNTHTVNVLTETTNNTSSAKETTNKPTNTTVKITTAEDLQKYLVKNYSSCDTGVGTTKFEISVRENDSTLFPYDYNIVVKYDLEFFMSINTGIKYTAEQKQSAQNKLKDHMKKIADDCINLMPTKKFQGSYRYSFYRYPTIKEGLEIMTAFNWSNFESTNAINEYDNTKASTFRWTTLYDNFFI